MGRAAAIFREKMDKTDLRVCEHAEGAFIRVYLICHPHGGKTLHLQKDDDLPKAQMLVSIFLRNEVSIMKVCTLPFLGIMLLHS